MHTSRRVLLPLILILLLATAARIYHIEAQSIWFDEGWSAYAANQPTIIDAANADATNPPLYYMLLHIAARGFGDSEFALRFFSLLASLVAVALTYRLAREVFNPRAGVYASWLAALSPLLWWAAQEARMYTLLAVLVLAAALGWHRLLRAPTRAAWLMVWGAELALLYAHNTGPVVALWLNAVTLVAWAISRASRPNPRLWIAGQVAVALLWSPYFVTRFLALGAANSSVANAPSIDLLLLASIWAAFWAGNWALVDHSSYFSMLGIPGVMAVLALLLIPWRRAAARWMVLHVVVLIAGLVGALMVLGNDLHGRYLVMIAPLLVIPIGAGIARFSSTVVRRGMVVVFGYVLSVAIATVYFDPYRLYWHDDARGMVQYYADNLSAEDTVLAWSYADRYELAYYWDRLGVTARRVTLPEGEDLLAILPLIPREGDVALNVWYTQRADYRGMLDCLLQNGIRHTPERYTVQGMSTLVYRDRVLDVPQTSPFATDYRVASVDTIRQIPPFTAESAVCMPITLTLLQPLDADLRAAVTIRNLLGWEVARADAVFAQADQRTTAGQDSGQFTAYALLRLPYGAPPGDYDVMLTLYDEPNEPSGYPASDTGARTRQIGTWSAPPGADWTTSNRSSDLPFTANLAVDDDLTLLAHDLLPLREVANGETVRMSMLWDGDAPLPDLMLADSEGRWDVTLPAPTGERDPIRLDWREATIPADAETGIAHFMLPDGTVFAQVDIVAQPMLVEPPAFVSPIEVVIPSVGALVGYTMDDAVSVNSPLTLAFVWRADAATHTSYTVFAQVIDANGVLIAQSDSVPAQGSRPTTGWRAGEYILDAHTLTFNEAAHAGTASLIVGMYDADTGERLTMPDGADAIRLTTLDVR